MQTENYCLHSVSNPNEGHSDFMPRPLYRWSIQEQGQLFGACATSMSAWYCVLHQRPLHSQSIVIKMRRVNVVPHTTQGTMGQNVCLQGSLGTTGLAIQLNRQQMYTHLKRNSNLNLEINMGRS